MQLLMIIRYRLCLVGFYENTLNNYYIIYDLSVIFALCDDKLMLMGGCTCSKHLCFLPPVFRLLCLLCLNDPFFVLLTYEIGVYL